MSEATLDVISIITELCFETKNYLEKRRSVFGIIKHKSIVTFTTETVKFFLCLEIVASNNFYQQTKLGVRVRCVIKHIITELLTGVISVENIYVTSVIVSFQ